jgi:hypothetical protein
VSISIMRGKADTLRVAVRTAEPDGTRSDLFRDVQPGETFFRIPYQVLHAPRGRNAGMGGVAGRGTPGLRRSRRAQVARDVHDARVFPATGFVSGGLSRSVPGGPWRNIWRAVHWAQPAAVRPCVRRARLAATSAAGRWSDSPTTTEAHDAVHPSRSSVRVRRARAAHRRADDADPPRQAPRHLRHQPERRAGEAPEFQAGDDIDALLRRIDEVPRTSATRCATTAAGTPTTRSSGR